jgi:uncharacterized protein (TIGR00303 family)
VAEVRVYTQLERGERWLQHYRGCMPLFACILGFTETGLIPGISAAGATPADRQYTAIADAEFLVNGPQPQPRYPLPPLDAGASPVLISRAVVDQQQIPVQLFNAGLPQAPPVVCVDLGGKPAQCVSTGNALDLETVKHLFQQGLQWGEKLAAQVPGSYVILGECVVGGTTTALAVLTGLGWDALGKVNSSHPTCNHTQKWAIVTQGLQAIENPSFAAQFSIPDSRKLTAFDEIKSLSPLQLVAAVGDPMQPVVAGMAIAASRHCGVLLAGGTQMLAVYALIQAISKFQELLWQPDQVVVGSTRWVVGDPTGDTVGLAQMLHAPLLATQLNFHHSRYAQLRVYEQGYVKEGVGAGGCAIAAHLHLGWHQAELLHAIEALANRLEAYQQSTQSEL